MLAYRVREHDKTSQTMKKCTSEKGNHCDEQTNGLDIEMFSVLIELTTFSTTWLMHVVYETKGVSPCIQWLVVAFHRVRVRVRVHTIQRVCQPCCRQSGKVPSLLGV